MQKLCKQPQNILSRRKTPIEGVTFPNIYIGKEGSFTPIHNENYAMSSVNLLHQGDPKKWQVWSSRESKYLEKMLGVELKWTPEDTLHNLRHKCLFIHEAFFQKYNIFPTEVIQEEGEMIVG